MEVSVILIAKKESELKNILKDLKKQDYDDFEIVKITGSMSIPEAWNIGIRKAKGKILLFSEADVRIQKDWIKKMVNLVKKKGFAMGSEVLATRRNLNMCSVGIKSEIAKNVLFDETFDTCEDTEWFERLRRMGYKIESEKEPVVYHYKSTDPRKRLLRAFKNGKNHVRIWLKHDNPEMNFKRIILSRGFYITKEILQLVGVIWGLVRYSYLIPRKIFHRIKRS
ncbi:MAG: glycosyltransferase [Candidatus Aenigmarchaeota archaeon]|nr:glycosyltransferase [Candidatus Aenigmarchaeota archaeon]